MSGDTKSALARAAERTRSLLASMRSSAAKGDGGSDVLLRRTGGLHRLTEADGDRAAADLIACFGSSVDASLEGDASIVDRMGDAVFLVGEPAERTLPCIQRL